MKKVLALLAVGFSFAINTQAAVINLLPSNSNISISDDVVLNVNVSGLDKSASALGVYDLNLKFDSNLFAVKNIQFGDSSKGNQLDILGFGTMQTSAIGSGWLNLFELSFDTPENLNNLQANEFILFRVIFTALDKGAGLFSVNANSFGDAYGNNLLIDSISDSNVMVKAVSVPEPTSLFLLGLGLLTLGINRTKHKY